MVPSGKTTRSSLVTNDASAWYLTVGLACGRHLRRIRWRAAAGGSNVYALGVSCNCKRESLRCRTGLAAVVRRSSQASVRMPCRANTQAHRQPQHLDHGNERAQHLESVITPALLFHVCILLIKQLHCEFA